MSGALDVGLGVVSDASAKFGDYSGLQRKGGFLVLGGEATLRGSDGHYADLRATDLGLDARSLWARGGREGLYGLQLGYDELPRHFGDGALTPFLGAGGDRLTLPGGFASASTGTMPLAATLRPVDLALAVRRFDLAGSWLGTDRLTLRVSLRRDERKGTRPLTASFLSTAAQLPAAVDHVTDQFEVAASYGTPVWNASLAYQLSQFRNGSSALTWDNPFNAVVPGAVRGQLATAPDNELHQITGSAAYRVSPAVQVSADFTAGRLLQNQPYLASTLNANLAPTLPPLPAASLDGKVNLFNGSVRLTAAPLDGLRLSATYARDVRDNRTQILSYRQVASDIFVDPTARRNTPFSHWQDRVKLQADWRGKDSLRLSGGVDYDSRERTYTEVVTTRETTVWARAAVQPTSSLGLAVKVAHADRDHSTYGTSTWFGMPENPLLRKYNLAARLRSTAAVRADWNVNERVAIGLNAEYAEDEYRRSAIGLQSGRSVALGADASAMLSERTSVTAYGHTDAMQSRQAGSQAVAAADWTARNKDRFDLLGLGLRHTVIADKLDVGLDFSRARSRSDLSVVTLANEAPFPQASTAVNSLKLRANYKLSDTLSITGQAVHESYRAQDWQQNSLMPATLFNLLSFGQQQPHYRVTALSVALRYRF
jgi:MtrB/PioB family decaheme-associated outer membrane protein